MRLYIGLAFLSAFLLFLVQPLIARAILPWFGGAPAVWTTAMLFFQVGLLLGYGYAHASGRLSLRRHAVLHLALLVLTLLALPIIPSDGWKPTGAETPVWRILGLLAATIGMPYLLLATSAPLLQDWLGRTRPDATPYRLYAWSNAGSLIALAAYPFLLEPLLAVDSQAWAWSAAYAAFVAGWAWLALRLVRGPGAPRESAGAAGPPPTLGEQGLWFGLSACGAGLLLAITNLLTLDVAAAPFLWLAPLAAYLATFILSFAGRYRRLIWRPVFTAGLGLMAVQVRLGASMPLWAQAGAALLTLFAGCMVCHGELALRAPPAAHLTRFYLVMAAGGAAAGIAVGLVAPAVLRDFWELPLPYVLLLLYRDRRASGGAVRVTPLSWAALVAILWLGITAFVLPVLRRGTTTVASARNFYGVLRVADDVRLPSAMRRLRHGRIVHGTQFLDPARQGEPTAYYAHGSGVDLAIRQHLRRKAGLGINVAAVGLGAGTIAAYGLPGDSMRFYEINPDVVDFAHRHFSYLRRSPAVTDVVLGDARLSLEREMDNPANRGRYDVMVVDAFSGDAVPVHLLTLEAMTLYWTALRPDGVLALHVSNRHLDLSRVVYGTSRQLGRTVIRVRRGEGAAAISSTWVLVAGDTRFFHALTLPQSTGTDLPLEAPVVWTDRYSNLLGVLQ